MEIFVGFPSVIYDNSTCMGVSIRYYKLTEFPWFYLQLLQRKFFLWPCFFSIDPCLPSTVEFSTSKMSENEKNFHVIYLNMTFAPFHFLFLIMIIDQNPSAFVYKNSERVFISLKYFCSDFNLNIFLHKKMNKI